MSIPTELLDDLAVRFVLNMPAEEKDDPIRICFQIEVAFWFYTDFYCETIPNLPRLKLRKFAMAMFEYIPRLQKFLSPEVFNQVISSWIEYKFSIPTSGAVLLDKSLEYVLLVQGYGSKNWSFPKGKVNHDETLMNCAIREVLEETGYNCAEHIYEDIAIDRKIFETSCRLFIVTDVEMDYAFHPHVRNEIRSIQWFLVNQLPMRPVKKSGGFASDQQSNFSAKFYTVYPFVPLIRKWIEKERKHRRKVARMERRTRTYTGDSVATNSEDQSGSGGDDRVPSFISNSNSPFTLVDVNKSTSFVDVKLDDIYNDSEVDTGKSFAQQHEQSVAGLAVFNADSDPESGGSPPKEKGGGLQDDKSSYPTNWQALVNAYNRSNSINTPIGYDLLAEPRGEAGSGYEYSKMTMSTPVKGQGAPPPSLFHHAVSPNVLPLNGNVIKAEDLEAAAPASSPPASAQHQDGTQLANLLGSKALTCGDKLNFLFSMAASSNQQAPIASPVPPPSLPPQVPSPLPPTLTPILPQKPELPHPMFQPFLQPIPQQTMQQIQQQQLIKQRQVQLEQQMQQQLLKQQQVLQQQLMKQQQAIQQPQKQQPVPEIKPKVRPPSQPQQNRLRMPPAGRINDFPTLDRPNDPPVPVNYVRQGVDPKIVPEVQAKICLLIDQLKFLNSPTVIQHHVQNATTFESDHRLLEMSSNLQNLKNIWGVE